MGGTLVCMHKIWRKIENILYFVHENCPMHDTWVLKSLQERLATVNGTLHDVLAQDGGYI